MISVVIVSWNVRDLLRGCLSALRDEGTRRPLEIFVVDNDSADGSADMVASEFPEVRLMRNRENVGFARGCNQALREARGEFCVLLNPDTRLMPGALETLRAFLLAHPRACAAGPRLLNPDGSLQPNGHVFPRLSGTLLRALRVSALFPRWYDRRYRWGREDFDQEVQVDWVCGACLMLRGAALEELGLLHEGYFLYYEEVEWLLHARRAGWTAHYVPTAVVQHAWGASTAKSSSRWLDYLRDSQYRYFRRTASSLLAPAAWLFTRLEWLSHRLALALRGAVRTLRAGPSTVREQPARREDAGPGADEGSSGSGTSGVPASRSGAG